MDDYNPQSENNPQSEYNTSQQYNSNQQYGANQPYNQQPPPQQYNVNQPYTQQYPPQQQYPPVQWPHMRLGEWIITMLLMAIPVVNIVLMFMWAFGSNVNPSKKTYFQAMLIWIAVGVVIGIVIGGFVYSMFIRVFNHLY